MVLLLCGVIDKLQLQCFIIKLLSPGKAAPLLALFAE